MFWLRQSTAATVRIGPFVDETDAKTFETALTIQKADVKLSKAGGALAAASADQGTSNAGAPYDANGEYAISLDTTDTGTVGRLKLSIYKSGALPVWAEFMVLPAMVYDSLVAGTDYLDVSLVQWLGTAPLALVNQLVQVDTLRVGGTLQTAGDVPDGLNTLIGRLTATRAGYLDKLNITGNVASSAEVTAIQNNTRCVRAVPVIAERPDTGSVAYRIELYLYDENGNMEAPDSAPTLSVVNQSGTSRDANLDSTTMTLVSTGRYRSTYTVDAAHAIEELLFVFSVVEGAVTRSYGNSTQIVDTTAVDFTNSDRTLLQAIASAATEARLAELDAANLPAAADTAANAAISAATSADTAATQATGANTKAADLQSRVPAALSGGRMPAVLAATPPTLTEIRDGITADHGSGSYVDTGGDAAGAYTITVTVVDDDTDLPLSQAQVTIRDSGGAVHHQERTDSSGEVSCPAGDDDYTVSVLGLPGYNGVANQAFEVDGAGKAVEVRLVPIASVTPNPGTRLVRVITVDPSGALLAGVRVTAHLTSRRRSSVDQALLVDQTLTATSDEDGVADLVLITADQFEEGDGEYVIKYGSEEVKATIPAGAGVLNLQEYLVPDE